MTPGIWKKLQLIFLLINKWNIDIFINNPNRSFLLRDRGKQYSHCPPKRELRINRVL